MVDYQDGIPTRELTLQYRPLTDSESNTPSVANGTEVKLFAESIKEIFQKEPTFTPIQKGPKTHYEGDKTLVTDTLKANHKWEITAWVYSNKNGKHSLDSSILTNNDTEADITTDTVTAEEFDKYIPLGDTGIKYDSESVSISGGSSLKRGFKKSIVAVDTTNEVFTVSGDETGVLSNGDNLQVTGSTGNNGSYTVSSASYDSGNDETDITVNEDVTDGTADGELAANDYQVNYSQGEIKYFDTGTINSTTETTTFGPIDLGTRTVITDDFDVTYTFDASARNVANLLVRMSQLGNPFVMRLDKSDFTAESGSTDARDFMVIPKKVQINSQASKPDEYKLELELRKATVDI